MFAHFLRDGETCRIVVLCADNPLTRRNTRQSFAGLGDVFVEFAERAALKVAEQLSRCIVAAFQHCRRAKTFQMLTTVVQSLMIRSIRFAKLTGEKFSPAALRFAAYVGKFLSKSLIKVSRTRESSSKLPL